MLESRNVKASVPISRKVVSAFVVFREVQGDGFAKGLPQSMAKKLVAINGVG